MKYQTSQATCGPASLSNALKALGRDVSEAAVKKAIEKLGSYRPAVNGTTQEELARASEKWAKVVMRGTCVDNLAIQFLRGELVLGRVAILGVDNGTHWVAAVGLLGKRFLVADPAHEELVLSYTGEELKQRWVYHDAEADTLECEVIVLEAKR